MQSVRTDARKLAQKEIDEANRKAEEVLGRFGQIEVTRAMRNRAHDIHVTYAIADEMLWNMRDADEGLWPYIADRLGAQIAQHLQSMRFGSIMEGREVVNRFGGWQ